MHQMNGANIPFKGWVSNWIKATLTCILSMRNTPYVQRYE